MRSIDFDQLFENVAGKVLRVIELRRKGCPAHQQQEEKPSRAGFEHRHLL
jgi:hypothetical protein